MKFKIFSTGILGMLVLLMSAFIIKHSKPEFLDQHATLLLRVIGHELLTLSGDSTSRVLPINELKKGLFQIDFQSDLVILPDSLVSIVRSSLDHHQVPNYYAVTVFECRTLESVYGFAIKPEGNDIVPCLGRVLPKACYSIQIEFNDPKFYSNKAYQFAVAISLVVFTFLGYKFYKQPTTSKGGSSLMFSLGSSKIDVKRSILMHQNKSVVLSDKETQILSILAQQQNTIVSRERLMKEVWEDDGVITSRSLDVFVSRLRKKLSVNSKLILKNVYGKGYILEVH